MGLQLAGYHSHGQAPASTYSTDKQVSMYCQPITSLAIGYLLSFLQTGYSLYCQHRLTSFLYWVSGHWELTDNRSQGVAGYDQNDTGKMYRQHMCHMSHVTCHRSHGMCHLSLVKKRIRKIGRSDEASHWRVCFNGAYPV